MIYTLTLNPAVDKEYSVQHLAFDEVLRASNMQVDFGGKGFNVSRMLAVLGASSIAIGLAGGNNGDLLRKGLESAGIHTDFVKIEGDTRTDVSIVEENHGRHIKVNEPGPLVSEKEIAALITKITLLAAPEDYWILSGSLPPGIPENVYAQIIHIVQKIGARAILDSSGEALRLGSLAGPYLVKPNASEASQISRMPAETFEDLARICQYFHALGVEVAVISAGKKGAFLSDGNKQWIGHPPDIKELNPIGSGDAMLAGIAWQFALGGEPTDALRWGLACGAAAASQPGTGMASKAVVKSLFDKTRLENFNK